MAKTLYLPQLRPLVEMGVSKVVSPLADLAQEGPQEQRVWRPLEEMEAAVVGVVAVVVVWVGQVQIRVVTFLAQFLEQAVLECHIVYLEAM
jgi:hypothetical protein